MNYNSRKAKNVVLLAFVLQFSFLLAGTIFAWTGKVVGIADGDTITVLRDGHD